MILTAIEIGVVHIHTFEAFRDFGITPISAISGPFENGENIAEIVVNAFKIFPKFAEELPMSLNSFGALGIVSVDSCVK